MEDKTVYVKADTINIKVSFNYDTFMVNKMREFTSRRFDKNTKEHLIPITHRSFNKLFNEYPVKLKEYTFIFDKSFKDLRYYYENLMKKREEMRDFMDLLMELRYQKQDLDLPNNYQPKIKSMQHQIYMLFVFIKLKWAAFFSDMGTGKTKAVIDSFDYQYQQKRIKRCLVICKLTAINDVWRDQIKEFSNHNFVNIRQVFTDMKIEYNKYNKVNNVKNYDSKKAQKVNKQLSTFYINKLDNLKNIDGFHVINFDIVKDYVDMLTYLDYDMVVIDESHKIGNIKSKRSKAIYQLSRDSKYRIVVTGTPKPNNYEQLFGQFYFLDDGETFGRDIYDFYNEFFKKIGAMFRGFWVPQKDIKERIVSKIYPRSITYRSDECFELPKLIPIVKRIPLTREQMEAINKFETESDEENYRMKLRTICCGFYYDNPIVELKSNKYIVLKDLIEELVINNEEKLIIWTNFNHEVKLVKKVVEDLKLRYALCTGEVNANKQDEETQRFKNSKTCNIFISNLAKGAESLNLFMARYSIYMSNPDNFDLKEQSLKRNHRKGCEGFENLITYDLISENSIEEEIEHNLKGKKEDHNYIFKYSEKRYKYNIEVGESIEEND